MEPNFQPAEPRSVAVDVRRLRDGDPEAAEALARRATRLALRTAAALLESREEASDIAQDVAVDALRSLRKLRDPEAFDAWVHRITVRHAMRRLKRRRRARETETPLALLAEAAQPPVPQDMDPDALIAARQALAAALTELPARQRLALALRYVHDLSDAQIAAALGCRQGTVHALLSRGRETLRRDPHLIEIAIDFKGG
ncbi:MAG: sigma-70 family RNA polymerase sigma factor [Actinobacteria bacterium]|nr:sigma-70 family RNA polymerase sigma factor [Actinomycetota bacterium]